MTTIGAYEAKTHLPRLLEKVQQGESFTITKHGREVARLVPIDVSWVDSTVIDAVLEVRDRVAEDPDASSVRELIERGRRS